MAEKINFTKTTIQAAIDKYAGTRKVIHDTKQAGLILDLRPSGAASFYLYKWHNGRPKKMHLGRVGEMTVEQARDHVVKHLGQMVEGKDPVEERRTARREHTLGALFDWWLENHAKQHRRSWPEDKRRYDQLLTHWSTRRLSAITEADVQVLHAKIGKDNGKVTANRVVGMLCALFNKAKKIGYTGANPTKDVQKFTEQSRDRFLQPNEVPAFFKALAKEPEQVQDFFMLALLTGARRRNVQSMRWGDVHLDGQVWRIPETKAGIPVVVHLPEKAVEILRRRKANDGASEWVFPAQSKTGHLQEPRPAWMRILNNAGLADLHIHDLRRTLGSWQAIGGASLTVIGKSLGQTSLAATARYARLTTAPVVESVTKATDALLAAAKPKRKRSTKGRKSNGKA